MEAVYGYQLAKKIITPSAASALKGYLGPQTRIVLNKDYALFLKKGTSIKPAITVPGVTTIPHKNGTTRPKPVTSQTIQAAQNYLQSRNFILGTKADTGTLVGNSDIDLAKLQGRFDVAVTVKSKQTSNGVSAKVRLPE